MTVTVFFIQIINILIINLLISAEPSRFSTSDQRTRRKEYNQSVEIAL